MTTDLDGYLLKCIIDGLGNNQEPEGLTELCACSLGLELTKEGDE